MKKALLAAFCASLVVLVASAGEFRKAAAGYAFEFPRDHGSHPDYRTEWWYYTGHLRAASGKRYGFEVTFFRVGIAPPGTARQTQWDLQQIMPAHFAITDLDVKAFRYYEKLNRASPFTADAAVGRLDVFNEGWHVAAQPDGTWRLTAAAGKDSIALTLRALKPPAVNGENGVSVKAQGEGYASHYYSMTRLEAAGIVNGERCSGQAWMDHEFGSSALRENQQGWDWFSIQLDDATELMLYIMRRSDGTADVTSSGTFVTRDGRAIHILRDEMRIITTAQWKSPKSKATYPMGWRVEVPRFKLSLQLEPLLRDQELLTQGSTRVTYWEGAVDVKGTAGGTAVGGKGYVEMTGYAAKVQAP